MPVTMRDVAREAGVSIKTVSRVVNDQGEIADDTRQRVQAVIDKLGYRPNLIARGLVTQRSFTVGLVFPDITNPFFPEVARGVQDIARENSYNTLLCNSDESQQEELRVLHSLAAQGVDGIIIFPCHPSSDNLNIFAEEFGPIVTVNHFLDHPTVSVVMTDNDKGARLVVDYLIRLGHQNIAMLAGLEKSPERGRRLHGFLEAFSFYPFLPIEYFALTSHPYLIPVCSQKYC